MNLKNCHKFDNVFDLCGSRLAAVQTVRNNQVRVFGFGRKQQSLHIYTVDENN
jgi:hypothetical protein